MTNNSTTRIYDEFKALSFADGYFLCYPIKLDGNQLTYSAVVVPPTGDVPDFDITFAGKTVDYKIDSTVDDIVLRLNMPAGHVKRIKFTIQLSDSDTEEIVCQQKITHKKIGCSYYLPNNVRPTLDGVESKHMLRVIQNDDTLYFSLSGFDDYKKLKAIAKGSIKTSNKGSGDNTLKILDWGVGAGRVANHMRNDSEIEMYGVDIDPVNMTVLHSAGYPDSNFKLMEPGGDIPFPAETFDAVYGISVFTHLTEELQFKYLKELNRVIKPGGVGIFSVHGFIHFFSRINDGNMFYKWMENGFYVTSDNFDLTENFAESNTERLYVNTLHTPNYVFEKWLPTFSRIHIVKAPNVYGHDLLVCQK